ncbi:Uncharacterized protein dnm_029810 [Desulfonema magnum]|uniref:Uncharacterized protein n=1 Tax=Desulfonema magnum TaxID=45655 RepID=A0A975GMN8_9BACT|nr:Uncharacterized protein dnm_029810 [Desulfonema magnum]
MERIYEVLSERNREDLIIFEENMTDFFSLVKQKNTHFNGRC